MHNTKYNTLNGQKYVHMATNLLLLFVLGTHGLVHGTLKSHLTGDPMWKNEPHLQVKKKDANLVSSFIVAVWKKSADLL